MRPYNTLPKDIREVIESSEIDEAIQSIGDRFKVHIDQTGLLYQITNGVLTDQIKATEFVAAIEKNLKVSHDQAVEIAKAVNEKVFLQVRESLKKIHGVGEEKPREQAPLEKKHDVLQAIEAPESVPMRPRILEATAVKPAPLPIVPPEITEAPGAVLAPAPASLEKPAAPEPKPESAPAPTITLPPEAPVKKIETPAVVAATPAPEPAPLVTPTPTPKVAVTPPPVAVPPPAPKKPAPQPAPRAAGIDPYREATV